MTARVYCFALCTASRLFQARRHIVRRFIENEMAASRFNYFAPWLAFGDLTLAETLCPVELFAENVMPAFAGLKKAGDEFLRTLGLLTL